MSERTSELDRGNLKEPGAAERGEAPTPGTPNLLRLAQQAAVVSSITGLVILLMVGVAAVIDVLLLVFVGLLFAILLRSLSDLIARYLPIGDGTALATAIALILGLALGGTLALAPKVLEQVDQLEQSLPESIGQLQEHVRTYELGRWALRNMPAPADVLPAEHELLARMTGFFSRTLGVLGGTFIVLVTGIYLAAQPRLYVDGATRLFPVRSRARARRVMRQLEVVLKWWLLSKLFAMSVVGILTYLGLLLLGLELAVTLSVVAALFTFIPNFGPILAAVPAVLLGLLTSPMMALWVVVLYTAIQIVETYFLTPLIEQQTIHLPPALTITAQLAMGVLVGGVGLALAAPLTAALMVLVRTLYVEDFLEDPQSET